MPYSGKPGIGYGNTKHGKRPRPQKSGPSGGRKVKLSQYYSGSKRKRKPINGRTFGKKTGFAGTPTDQGWGA